MNSGDIVVGVDESPESRWAVLWAAREARLRSATLTLVHVRSAMSEGRVAGDDTEKDAETLLAVRAAEASEFEPGMTIRHRLVESGSISEQLIELSGAAALLVLGVASARPRADHGLLGPVEDRVVVHAHCPVVTVNGPGPIVGQGYDKIVLGWTEGATGRRALEAAADEGRYEDRYSASSLFRRGLRTHGQFLPSKRALSKRSSIRFVESRALTWAFRSMSHTEVVTWLRSWNSHWIGRLCSCRALITVSSPGVFASERSPRS
jgi:nucleotide-binding universal stress UspA family protein